MLRRFSLSFVTQCCKEARLRAYSRLYPRIASSGGYSDVIADRNAEVVVYGDMCASFSF